MPQLESLIWQTADNTITFSNSYTSIWAAGRHFGTKNMIFLYALRLSSQSIHNAQLIAHKEPPQKKIIWYTELAVLHTKQDNPLCASCWSWQCGTMQ